MISMRLLTLSQRQPGWLDEGFREYQRRLSAGVRLELVELPLPGRRARSQPELLKAQEAERLRRNFSSSAIQVALDVSGRKLTTEQMAQQLQEWVEVGQDVDLLIGGPDGLAESVRDEARLVWSLSPLTFPHGLVRVIVAEQVYRAWTILQGHPYHRS